MTAIASEAQQRTRSSIHKGGNLVPCKPGETRNPQGRPSAGATVREWFNAMAGYTEEELREAIRDKQSPVAKIGAAVAWTFAISQGLTRTGSPVFLPVLQEIADRTDGKTHQQISIQTTTTTIGVDLTKLSVDQLKALQAIVAAQHGDKASKQLDMIDMATDGKAIT